MTARKKTANWLIEQLEKQKESFSDETLPFASSQLQSFNTHYDLLKEDAQSLKKGSRQRRSARLLARSLLADIFFKIGQEVFFLCTFAASITTLSTINQDGLVPKIRLWWDSANHPDGLTGSSRRACEVYSIEALFASLAADSTEPPNASYVQLPTESFPAQHPKSGTDASQGEFSLAGSVGQSYSTSRPGLEAAALRSDQPERSVLRFNFTDFLSFLKQHQDNQTQLQMICSYEGVPLPYIDFNLNSSLGWNGKIEFSYELSTAFIKYLKGNESEGLKDVSNTYSSG